jgi:SAM-dependent methyltransferase
VNCYVCGRMVNEIEFKKCGVAYRRCSACAAIFAERIPKECLETENDALNMRANSEFQSERLRRIENHLGHIPRKMVDFGCGQGQFVQFLQSSGVKVVGVDRQTSVQLADLRSSFYSAVSAIEVLEHLYNPCEIFAEMKRVLVPGGVIYVESSFVDYIGDPMRSDYVDPRIGHCCIHSAQSVSFIAHRLGLQLDWVSQNVFLLKRRISPFLRWLRRHTVVCQPQ